MLAQHRKEESHFILTRYAMERLLYRLTRSPHSDIFVLKGGMLFLIWTGQAHRPTKDLDLLGAGEPSQDRFLAIVIDRLLLTPTLDLCALLPTCQQFS